MKNKNQIRLHLSDQLESVLARGDFRRFQIDPDKQGTCIKIFRGIEFIPVVNRDLNTSCGLTIRVFRPELPGDIVHGGDLDNRVKTVLDALRVPQNSREVIPSIAVKDQICLLEDDSLITDFAVSSVTALQPLSKNHVRLIIDVELRPFDFWS